MSRIQVNKSVVIIEVDKNFETKIEAIREAAKLLMREVVKYESSPYVVFNWESDSYKL